MFPVHRPLARTGFAAIALLVAGACAEAAPFDEPRAELRLLDGGVKGETYLAGVEIRLDEGWKTYWRSPGDSGIPPSFDFSASTNVASVEVKWPAPSASHDGYGWVIGYQREVVFPVVVKPQEPDRPVELVLDLDYAICLDVCIPMEGDARLTLSEAGADSAAIEPFLARVPALVRAGDPRGSIVGVARIEGPEPSLEFEVRMQRAGVAPLLLVEGPEQWYLPLPEHFAEPGEGLHKFRLALDGVPDGAELAGTPLRLTGVGETFSFEQTVTLD